MKRHFKNEPTTEQLDEFVKYLDRFEHHGLFLDNYRFFSFNEMPNEVAEPVERIAVTGTPAGTSLNADVASQNVSAGDDAVARSKDVREKLRGLFGKSPEELHQVAPRLVADGEGVDDVLDKAEKSANKKTPAVLAGNSDNIHADGENASGDGEVKTDVDSADQKDASPQLPPNWIEVPLYDENALHDLYRPLAQKAGTKEAPEHLVQRLGSYLKRGNKRRLIGLPPDWSERLDALTIRFLNFKAVIEYVRTECQVASLSASTAVKLAPILLGGPPGIGKTAFALDLASILNSGFYTVAMENAQSGAAICGSAKFWSNTRTGLVFDALMDHEFINPVFLIDELDKASGSDRFDPIAPLYQLLERRTAAMFRDESIPELSIDTSYINWILTANDMERIPAPIRSRLHIFAVPPPTYDQTKKILQRLFIETVTELKANVVAPDYVVLLDQMTLSLVAEDALSLFGIRVVKRLIRSATVKALGRRSSVVEFPDIYDLASFEIGPIYMLPQ